MDNKDKTIVIPYPNFVADFSNQANLAELTTSQKVDHFKKKVSIQRLDTLAYIFDHPEDHTIEKWIALGQRYWENFEEKIITSNMAKIRIKTIP